MDEIIGVDPFVECYSVIRHVSQHPTQNAPYRMKIVVLKMLRCLCVPYNNN